MTWPYIVCTRLVGLAPIHLLALQAPSGEQQSGEDKGHSVMVTKENLMVFVENFHGKTR